MIRTGTVSRNARPATSGATASTEPKHRRRTLPTLDAVPFATCDDEHGQRMGWGCIEPWCRLHDPDKYALVWAAHRADEPHHQCGAHHPEGDPCPDWMLL